MQLKSIITNQPTKEGYYWLKYKGKGDAFISYFELCDSEPPYNALFDCGPYDEYETLEDMIKKDVKIAGPILKPTE